MVSTARHRSVFGSVAQPAVVLVVLVLFLLPSGWTGWLRWLRNPVETVLSPFTSVVSDLFEPIGQGGGPPLDAAAVEELRAERELYRGLAARYLAENDRLRGQLARIARVGAVLGGDADAIASLEARVQRGSLTPGSTVLTVRHATRSEPVPAGAVGVAEDFQLVGRVVDGGRRTARVRPVTDADAEPLIGAVVLDGSTMAAPIRVLLRPQGDGTLAGQAEYVGPEAGATDDDQPPRVEPGMEVRLADPSWPEAARMVLVVGFVESVRPDEQMPLRQTLVVRPGLSPEAPIDLHRLSRLVIWAPLALDGDAEVIRNGPEAAP